MSSAEETTKSKKTKKAVQIKEEAKDEVKEETTKKDKSQRKKAKTEESAPVKKPKKEETSEAEEDQQESGDGTDSEGKKKGNKQDSFGACNARNAIHPLLGDGAVHCNDEALKLLAAAMQDYLTRIMDDAKKETDQSSNPNTITAEVVAKAIANAPVIVPPYVTNGVNISTSKKRKSSKNAEEEPQVNPLLDDPTFKKTARNSTRGTKEQKAQ